MEHCNRALHLFNVVRDFLIIYVLYLPSGEKICGNCFRPVVGWLVISEEIRFTVAISGLTVWFSAHCPSSGMCRDAVPVTHLVLFTCFCYFVPHRQNSDVAAGIIVLMGHCLRRIEDRKQKRSETGGWAVVMTKAMGLAKPLIEWDLVPNNNFDDLRMNLGIPRCRRDCFIFVAYVELDINCTIKIPAWAPLFWELVDILSRSILRCVRNGQQIKVLMLISLQLLLLRLCIFRCRGYNRFVYFCCACIAFSCCCNGRRQTIVHFFY